MKLFNRLITAMSLCIFSLTCYSIEANSFKMKIPKQFCVEYKMTGQMIQGTTKTCARDYGKESFTITKSTIGFGTFTRSEHKHSITINQKIYNIDPVNMTGTVTNNPMAESIKSGDAESMAQQMIESMNYQDTGEVKTIIGIKCRVYKSNMAGTACFTDTAVMLEQEILGMGGQIATYYSDKESGDEDNYSLYKNVKIVEAPDIDKFMQNLGR